jgi:hypothetical protein
MSESGSGGRAFLLALFLFACLLPINLFLGSFRVDPYRLVLLAMFIPAAAYIFSGKAGFVTRTDVLMVFFGLWIMVTLIYHHGQWGFINGGITVVELVGAYMLGRILIRSPSDYRQFVRFFLITLVVILPFALVELLTGRWLIGEILGQVFPTHPRQGTAPRWGVNRVQAIASHSILFGIYCSIGFANAYYIYRRQIPKMIIIMIFVTAMTFSSLSAGPLLAVMIQAGIIAWGLVMKENWRALLIVGAIFYVVIDMLSNRGPVLIALETLTFSSGTAWTRINVYNYGSAEVLRHPILGIGFNDYTRPGWLTDSVDNYWLLTALRHGLVGFLLLASGLLLQLWRILRAAPLTEDAKTTRLAYLITFIGLAFSMATVHLWNSIASVVFFFFGAGAFLYTSEGARAAPAAPPATDAPAPEAEPRALAYRRLAATRVRPPAPARTAPLTPERAESKLRRAPETDAPRAPENHDRYRR